MAVGLTAFVFALAVRGVLHPSQTTSGWLVPWDLWLRGWSLITVNLAFYGYLCWLGFWFTRGTVGRERLFVIGWFTDILVSSVKTLRPEWTAAIQYLGAFGLGVALLAALSLLLHPPEIVNAGSDAS